MRSLGRFLLCLAHLVFLAPGLGLAGDDEEDLKCSPWPYALSVGERAICKFTQDVDVNLTRIPEVLPKVTCVCPGNSCSDRGDYRCVEIKSKYRVYYAHQSINGTTTVSGEIELPTSCVCAASRTAKALVSFVPRVRGGVSNHGRDIDGTVQAKTRVDAV